jgi:Tol biopolymer transport system component
MGARRYLILSCAVLPFAVACGRDWEFLDSPGGSDGPGVSAVPDTPGASNDPAEGARKPREPGPNNQPALSLCDDPPFATCDPLAAFGPPRLLEGLNTEDDEESAVLSDDELTIYFARGDFATDNQGWMDIYVATRRCRSTPFGPAVQVKGASTAAMDLAISPTADGLTMYIDSYVDGFRAVRMSTRNSLIDDFGPPSVVIPLKSGHNEDGMPFVLASGDVIYFSSSRINDHFDIFRAKRTRNEKGELVFGTPELVPGINDAALFDGYPVVSPNEATIYFGSARQSAQGTYATDIFMARRAFGGESFAPPTLVTELDDVAQHNYPSWISPDGCRLYFTSSRAGGPRHPDGSLDDKKDLWMAERHH